jgi:hypothetical protein
MYACVVHVHVCVYSAVHKETQTQTCGLIQRLRPSHKETKTTTLHVS